MNIKDFKFHYIWSLLSGSLALVFLIFGFIYAIYSSFDLITNSIQDGNISSAITILIHLLFFSGYTIFFLLAFIGTIIWNIYICYLRSLSQSNFNLLLVCLSGWILPIFIPFIGFIASLFIQVWAWRIGIQEN